MKNSWVYSVYSMEIRKILSYRTDFWIEFLGSIFFQFALSYYLWDSIFQDKNAIIQGMSFYGILFYYMQALFVLKILQGGSLVGYVAQDIYSGELNRYLIMPVSLFRFKLATHLAQSTFYVVQFLLFFFLFYLFFGFPKEIHFEPIAFFLALGGILISSFFYFQLVLCLEMMAFFAEQVWTLQVMLRFLITFLGGVLIPLNFFPEDVQTLLSYLPFPYLISHPIKMIQGQLPWLEWFKGLGILIFWSLLCSRVTKILWEKGNKHYTGVGI